MSVEKRAEEFARELQENIAAAARVVELGARPLPQRFDAETLRASHAFIFQDTLKHSPGQIRPDTENWVKARKLENGPLGYDVPYVSHDVGDKLQQCLDDFGGPDTLRGLSVAEASGRISDLYSDLDHIHTFHEGNSRALRVFTRQLAEAAGFKLNWASTNVDAAERNRLYIARDIEVIQRHYPGLDEHRADTTNDRAEYEAVFTLQDLKRRQTGSLADIIAARTTAYGQTPAHEGTPVDLSTSKIQIVFPKPGLFSRYASAMHKAPDVPEPPVSQNWLDSVRQQETRSLTQRDYASLASGELEGRSITRVLEAATDPTRSQFFAEVLARAARTGEDRAAIVQGMGPNGLHHDLVEQLARERRNNPEFADRLQRAAEELSRFDTMREAASAIGVRQDIAGEVTRRFSGIDVRIGQLAAGIPGPTPGQSLVTTLSAPVQQSIRAATVERAATRSSDAGPTL